MWGNSNAHSVQARVGHEDSLAVLKDRAAKRSFGWQRIFLPGLLVLLFAFGLTTPVEAQGQGAVATSVPGDATRVADPEPTLPVTDPAGILADSAMRRVGGAPAVDEPLLPGTPEAVAPDVAAAVVGTDPVPAPAPNGLLVLAVLLLALVTAGSVAVAFYLYRWRRLYQSEGPYVSVVPEQFNRWLKDLSAGMKATVEAVAKRTADTDLRVASGVAAASKHALETDSRVQAIATSLDDVLSSMVGMQKVLEEREAEIKRLRKGYDATVFRRFLRRFVLIDQDLRTSINERDFTEEALDLLAKQFDAALVECGVERFRPDIGSDFRSSDGLEVARPIKARNANEQYRIAEVISDGYRLSSDAEQLDIIVPAKVGTYVP